jgi:hypothetical protein
MATLTTFYPATKAKSSEVNANFSALNSDITTLDGRIGTLESSATSQAGWVTVTDTWTYASADDPTFTFTISGDKTAVLSAGMKIKLTQTSAKYFIITNVTYGAPNTTVTVYGGTDYDLTNATITSPYYSTARAPQGFPLSPSKWTVTVSDASDYSQVAPASGTWYNATSITIPIGDWRASYSCVLYCDDDNTGGYVGAIGHTTLSTANNTESDPTFSAYDQAKYSGVSNNAYSSSSVYRSRPLTLTAKATYYLNYKTSQANQYSVAIRGSIATTIIEAVCTYL